MLAELLMRLHDAGGSPSTVRATIREWRHHARTRAAMQAGDGEVVMYAPVDGPVAETSESIARICFAPPDRFREEREDGGHRSVGVRRGPRWWHHDRVNGTISNESDPDVGSGIGQELRWLIDPAALIGVLRFTEVRPGEQAGRPTLRAVGRPRRSGEGDDWTLMRLGAPGADEVVVDVDAERGVLLRMESRRGGEPYSVQEVLEIAFDEAFPDETFELQPPDGAPARSVRDRHRLHHDIPIDRAVALAPFPVWILRRLPADWEVGVTFAAGDDHPPQLFLHYRAEHGAQELAVIEMPEGAEHADELPGGGTWERVRRNGRELEVREPAEDWHPAQVRLTLEGTRILLHSRTLGTRLLADAAADLIRAPEGEPQLGG